MLLPKGHPDSVGEVLLHIDTTAPAAPLSASELAEAGKALHDIVQNTLAAVETPYRDGIGRIDEIAKAFSGPNSFQTMLGSASASTKWVRDFPMPSSFALAAMRRTAESLERAERRGLFDEKFQSSVPVYVPPVRNRDVEDRLEALTAEVHALRQELAETRQQAQDGRLRQVKTQHGVERLVEHFDLNDPLPLPDPDDDEA